MRNFIPMYIPILSVAPSEIKALSELPEKDKDLLLPYFPLKGWMAANKLESTTDKISSIFKDRKWIADIDYNFLTNSKIIKRLIVDGKYPREVYDQLINISKPDNGYKNWVEYTIENSYIIPTIQLEVLSELEDQCKNLSHTNKEVAIRLRTNYFTQSDIEKILNRVCKSLKNELYVIIDLGQVAYKDINRTDAISIFMRNVFNACSSKKNCKFSLSATSFPSSFSGMSEGESSIHERTIYNKVNNSISFALIYSDYASVTLNKAGGASRTPPPRIDYPRKGEWKHIRKDFEDVQSATVAEKHAIYRDLAKRLINKEYWIKDLMVWGTQQIEKTAVGDNFGITDAQKATSARINIHLFQQLHYSDVIEELDSDDDWID